MKFETNPGLVLGNFTALRSMSYSFSYNINDNIREAKQKRKHHTPKYTDYIYSLFNSGTTVETKSSTRSNLHQLSVEKQNKLALNPFCDKRMYINPIKSLP